MSFLTFFRIFIVPIKFVLIALSKFIFELEKKRDELNKVFQSDNQDPDIIIQASKDMKGIIAELDEKEMRWLELSELVDI